MCITFILKLNKLKFPYNKVYKQSIKTRKIFKIDKSNRPINEQI